MGVSRGERSGRSPGSGPQKPTCLPSSMPRPYPVSCMFSWSVVTSPHLPPAPSPYLSLGPSLSGGLFSSRQRRLQCAETPTASSMTSSTYLSSTVYPQRPTPMYPQCHPTWRGRDPGRKNTRAILTVAAALRSRPRSSLPQGPLGSVHPALPLQQAVPSALVPSRYPG